MNGNRKGVMMTVNKMKEDEKVNMKVVKEAAVNTLDV